MNNGKNQKGFSLIELLCVVVVIGIVAAIGIPNLTASRRAANESSAISSVRALIGAQASYQSTTGDGEFAPNFTLLRNQGLVESVLATGIKSGFSFEIGANSTGPAAQYDVSAHPTRYGHLASTGTRSFYTNELGMMYSVSADIPNTAGWGISTTVRTPTTGAPLTN